MFGMYIYLVVFIRIYYMSPIPVHSASVSYGLLIIWFCGGGGFKADYFTPLNITQLKCSVFILLKTPRYLVLETHSKISPSRYIVGSR